MAIGGVMVTVDGVRGNGSAAPPPSSAGSRIVKMPLPTRMAKMIAQVSSDRFLKRPSSLKYQPSGRAARDWE
jgi:hypothetical protein